MVGLRWPRGPFALANATGIAMRDGHQIGTLAWVQMKPAPAAPRAMATLTVTATSQGDAGRESVKTSRDPVMRVNSVATDPW